MNKQPKWTKNRRQRREQAKAVPWKPTGRINDSEPELQDLRPFKPSPGPIVGMDFSSIEDRIVATYSSIADLPRDKDGRITGMHLMTNGQMIGRGERVVQHNRAGKMTKLDRQLKYGLFEAPDAGLKRYLRA